MPRRIFFKIWKNFVKQYLTKLDKMVLNSYRYNKTDSSYKCRTKKLKKLLKNVAITMALQIIFHLKRKSNNRLKKVDSA
jgi:hypothetical protein